MEKKQKTVAIFFICIIAIISIVIAGLQLNIFSFEGISIFNENEEVYQKFQDYVKEVLKAPATAKFPPIDEATIVKKSENSWAVLSYCDAQNEFGAFLRGYYSCEFVKNQGAWTLLSLNTGDTKEEASFKWNYVTSFWGFDDSGDGQTSDFAIIGDIWRIEWEVGGVESYQILDSMYFSCWIHIASSGSTVDWISTDDSYDSGVKYIYEGKDTYYLDITTINLDEWELKIYQGTKVI